MPFSKPRIFSPTISNAKKTHFRSSLLPQSTRRINEISFSFPIKSRVIGTNEISTISEIREDDSIQNVRNQIENLELNLKMKASQLISLKETNSKLETENKKLYEENSELKRRRENVVKEMTELSNRISTPKNATMRREYETIGSFNNEKCTSFFKKPFSLKDIQKLNKARLEIESIYKEVINFLFSDKEMQTNPQKLDWVISLENKINEAIKGIKKIQLKYEPPKGRKSLNDCILRLSGSPIEI